MRQAVFDRDGRRCRCCQVTAKLCVDHIYPWALGGLTTLANLQTLCDRCSRGKSDRVITLDELRAERPVVIASPAP